METTKPIISESQLKKIKEEISNEANPKNMTEAAILINNPKLLSKLVNASEDFKKQVGREMTYSEMREMMG
jgi:oligoendopeptidase F